MSTSCRVITPVGPGHEDVVVRAAMTVQAATYNPGMFDYIEHCIVDDRDGGMGRGLARNKAMWDGWMFFLDADDMMMPDAFELCDFDSPATFGAVCIEGVITEANKFPCTQADLKKYGARGTLSMGFFYNGNLRFNEDMIIGEDFDFYMRLPSFVKVKEPLVSIGRGPSAHGPRGYDRIDWQGECQKVISSYIH